MFNGRLDNNILVNNSGLMDGNQNGMFDNYYSNQRDVITNGLVLHLDASNKTSCPGSTNTWNDLSGNGNNTVFTNAPVFNQIFKGGFLFNGSSNYLTITDSTSLRPSTFTIEAVFNIFSTSPSTIICKPFSGPPWTNPYLSYMIRVNNGATDVEFGTNINNVYKPSNLSIRLVLGINYFFSYTYNSSNGNISIYQNGNIVRENNIGTGTISYSTSPVLIGADYGGSPALDFTNGNIYVVRIYNRLLSTEEIKINYNATKTRFGL